MAMTHLFCPSILAMVFNIEFYACGLTSVNHDLVLFGIEDYTEAVFFNFQFSLHIIYFIFFFFENTAVDPSLTILTKKDKEYIEKAHDPFHMLHENITLPFQFQLGKNSL